MRATIKNKACRLSRLCLCVRDWRLRHRASTILATTERL